MTNQLATRYNSGAMLLHWLIAFALAAELALGFGMPRDASGFALYQLHKSLGLTILVLTLVRIGWRLTHAVPPMLQTGLAGLAVKAGHLALYAFMLAAPLTGWAIVSTAPIDVPTMLWGVIPWPHLPLADSLNHTLEEAHELIAFGGMALFVGHVVAALYHHFRLKDATMARMSPKGAAGIGLAMLVGVVVLHFGLVAVLPGEGEHEHEHEEGAAAAASATAEVAPAPSASASAAVEDPAAEETPAAEESAAAAAGPPPSWTIQPGGTLRFTADNGGTAINGTFRRWSGTIAMDPENPATANIAIQIDLASASLGDATQDQMLQGGEFFNSGANPTATFRSTDVTRTGNGYRARGTLSLRGASRPQTINFTLGGSGVHRQVDGSASIDRNAFGVGTGESAAGIAPTVRVEFSFHASS